MVKAISGRKKAPKTFSGVGTVFLSDVCAAQVTEGMDSVALVKELNELFAMSVNCVHEADGFVVNFVGDAVLAVWGPASVVPSHAEVAWNCGRKLLDRWKDVQAKKGHVFSLRILLATGDLTVTMIGGRHQVYGKPMAMVKRIEELKLPKRNQIICTADTWPGVGDVAGSRVVGRVKGASGEDVEVWEIS